MRRPAIHFAPHRGWMNDPNGCIVHDGRYHLFFQHNPAADTWGPMHWGHAVSTDLLRWDEWPIALAPDELGTIFSGSVVVDEAGSAGFGPGALVAIFTYDAPDGQSQALAGSSDGGRTWTKNPANPVLRAPDGLREFRDPRVLRWAPAGPAGHAHWVMLLACGRELRLYISDDLRSWRLASALADLADPGDTLETPDLFQAATDEGERHWVLSFGVLGSGPQGGSGTRYLVGAFDGSAFRPHREVPEWADLGPDFYAAQTWTGAPVPTWVGWLGNWAYSRSLPSSGWRGTMSIPRELSLARSGGSLRLRQRPALSLLHAGRVILAMSGGVLNLDQAIALDVAGAIDLELRVPHGPMTGRLAVEVLEGETRIAVLVVGSERHGLEARLVRMPLDLDSPATDAAWVVPTVIGLEPSHDMEIRMLVDATSIELFVNGISGSAVLPAPSRGQRRVRIRAQEAAWPIDRLACRVIEFAAQVRN